jgi:mannose-1-phosphate guanylyltransferase/mannose-1-phosphate guanylyltransferase/phosphomannomutase
MRAMILAAGLGTRLRPITYEMPKPMMPVLNRPVMEHIVELLASHGFNEVLANLHWFPEQIRERFGDGSRFGIDLTYSQEEALLGTAGGVRKAVGFLGDDFLVISGDALTDIDLAAMRDFHATHDGIATLVTKRVADTSQFGVVISGGDGRVQGFQEKPEPAEALSDLANCGIYMFRAEIFDFFPAEGERSKAAGPDDPPAFADWAMDVLPALLEADVPFYSHEIEAYWNDIGNLEELRQGNFDALRGDVGVDPGVPEVAPGVRAGDGTDASRAEVAPPALFGPAVELGSEVHIDGPAVIGDGSRIGAGSRIKESVLLPGSEIGPATVLAGAIAAKRRK